MAWWYLLGAWCLIAGELIVVLSVAFVGTAEGSPR